MSASGGRLLVGGVCPGGVCLGGVCPGDVCQRGVVVKRVVCLGRNDRMTDTCKNITLPQLHCGR